MGCGAAGRLRSSAARRQDSGGGAYKGVLFAMSEDPVFGGAPNVRIDKVAITKGGFTKFWGRRRGGIGRAAVRCELQLLDIGFRRYALDLKITRDGSKAGWEPEIRRFGAVLPRRLQVVEPEWCGCVDPGSMASQTTCHTMTFFKDKAFPRQLSFSDRVREQHSKHPGQTMVFQIKIQSKKTGPVATAIRKQTDAPSTLPTSSTVNSLGSGLVYSAQVGNTLELVEYTGNFVCKRFGGDSKAGERVLLPQAMCYSHSRNSQRRKPTYVVLTGYLTQRVTPSKRCGALSEASCTLLRVRQITPV